MSRNPNLSRRMHSTVPLEWIAWMAAVSILAFTDPAAEPLIDLCVWKLAGFESCPGCGMGHALAHLLRGDLSAGIQAHPLSPFAAAAILLRVKHRWPGRTSGHDRLSDVRGTNKS
ncbi:MAG: DUF2752 domain-containing protein [Rhodothermales bacterium]|nr:DUF2752 domain-containing protein [Rhodothermales bacterium]